MISLFGFIGRPLRVFVTTLVIGAAFLVAQPFSASSAKQTDRNQTIAELLIGKGVAALDKGKYDDARQSFEQAVVADPSYAKSFSYLGYAYFRMSNTELAKKYFDTALDIDPNEPHALTWGGKLDLEAADLEGAEAKLLRLSRSCGTDCSEYKLLSDEVSSYKMKAN